MAEDNTFSNPVVRLERRMVATGSGSIEQYAACLEDDPGEYRKPVSTFFIKMTELLEHPREERAGVEPSGREPKTLLLVARGLSNRQTSASPSLSVATVKRHPADLYAKMDVGSRGESTRMALSEGWFTARDVTHQKSVPDNPKP